MLGSTLSDVRRSFIFHTLRLVYDLYAVYDMIRYYSVYLTCSKKLTASQLSLPNRINKKLKCETKNKMVSVIDAVQSRYVKEIYGGKDLLKR